MAPSEIIVSLIRDFKTDQVGFADMLEVNKSTINNILNNRTKSISPGLAKKIVKLRDDINYNCLIGVEENLFLDKKSINKTKNNVTLNCFGKAEITLQEALQFIVSNLDKAQKEPAFKILKTYILNDKKIKILEKHLGIDNSKEEIQV